MGINPTQPNHKAFTFDGTSSRGYGVYITGEAVFNAPDRNVQMVDIPGRNGAYALDKGNFNNITVKYPASIVADNATDFAKAVSDLRNFLCSKTGYCRLEDEYNPDEYRMAIYKSGLEVSHDMLTAGEFDITFECKPQRYLTSGEKLIEVGEWGETEVVSGSIASFEASEVDKVKSITADINPIQDLHGYDSPWVGGGHYNQWDEEWEVGQYYDGDGKWNSNGTRVCSKRDHPIPVVGGGTYYIGSATTVIWFDATGEVYNNGQGYISYSYTNTTATAPSNAKFMRFYKSASYGSVYNHDIAINYPSTVTTYSPWQNICPISGRNSVEVTVTDDLVDPTDTDTYTTALGQTVYGGTLNVVSGVLTVDKAIKDLGTLTWIDATTYFYAIISDKARGFNNFISSGYTLSAQAGVANLIDKHIVGGNNDNAVYVKDSDYSDAQTFKTSVSGKTIVYELATPTTIQLTPTQVQTLLGTNNIFADSGDVTVEYGHDPNILTNPTLFDARPQLQVYGYGDIDLGGQEISVDNAVYGETLLANSKSISGGTVLLQNMDVMNNGDTFTVSGAVIELSYNPAKNYRVTVKDIGTGTNCTAVNGYSDQIRITPIDKTFAKGTSDSLSFSVTANVNVKPIASTSSVTTASTYSGTISYDGDSTLLFAVTLSPSTITNVKAINTNYKTPDIFGNSTKSILGNPLYIDLDIGDCWNEDSGVPVSVNNAVSLPAELPTLPSGDTTIAFDNTFTKVDIVPRWWKV